MLESKLKIKNIGNNIYVVYTDLIFNLAMAFGRISEFGESKSRKLKGKFFSWEEFMEVCVQMNDDYQFDYLNENSGFNIPGCRVEEFRLTFPEASMWQRESELIRLTENIENKFYIIGITGEDALNHEIAHALFYLDKDYRREVTRMVKRLPYRKGFEKLLADANYDKQVYIDEIQAYMAGDSKPDMIENIHFKLKWNWTSAFRKVLDRYIKKHNIQTEIYND